MTSTAVSFFLIHTLFYNYRQEEFQQRIKDHTISSITTLGESEKFNQNILQALNEVSVNRLYKEKTLIFNQNKKLIYSSIDDTVIEFSNDILKELNDKKDVVESRENEFDVIGMRYIFNGKIFYAITKAHDVFGYTKLNFLKITLIVLFFVISGLILLTSFLLSKQITEPLVQMAAALKIINIETQNLHLPTPEIKDEIYLLSERFNELLNSLHSSYNFQKNAIHHISHELKTPIAVLVSNLEMVEMEKDPEKIKTELQAIKADSKKLGDMINILLDIAKVESQTHLNFSNLRLDELVFESIENSKKIEPTFILHFEIDENFENEEDISIVGNQRLMGMAIQNLVNNCLAYSNKKEAKIKLKKQLGHIYLSFENPGNPISLEDQSQLFSDFFRGKNSEGTRGLGLGLSLVKKILDLHQAKIDYEYENGMNKFILRFTKILAH